MIGEGLVDDLAASWGEGNNATSPIRLARSPLHEPGGFEPIEALGHRAGRHHRVLGDLGWPALERRPDSAQGGEHIEVAFAEPVLTKHGLEFDRERRGEAVQSPDHLDR